MNIYFIYSFLTYEVPNHYFSSKGLEIATFEGEPQMRSKGWIRELILIIIMLTLDNFDINSLEATDILTAPRPFDYTNAAVEWGRSPIIAHGWSEPYVPNPEWPDWIR